MDPVADMFNRIKNAQAVGLASVFIPISKLKLSILETLKKEFLIDNFEKKGRGLRKNIEVILKYKDGIPAISGFRAISKPGQRIYAGNREIRKTKKGYGMAIISTSRGIMTDKEARKQKSGGEVLVEIW